MDGLSHETGSSAETASRSARPPSRWRRGLLLGLIAALVIVGCGVGAYFIGPQPCFPPNPTRHGLPCDVALPAHATFHDHQNSRYFGSEGTGSGETWTFTVTGTSLAQVSAFYAQRLPGTGWRCVATDDTTAVISGWGNHRRVIVQASPPDITTFPDSADDVVLTIGLVSYGSGGDAPAC
ncbi:MAG TPA: hypothetical protein VH349_08965 [Ktedonobacterales bacterium]